MTIDHVVVLCLENRSFDHMLGFLPHPDPDYEGLGDGTEYVNTGANGVSTSTSPDARRVIPFGPDHSHDAVMQQLAIGGPPWNRRPTNQGFVASYELKASGRGPHGHGGILAWPIERLLRLFRQPEPTAVGRGPLLMRCQRPAQVPVLSTLALEFAVCDHWFASVPGETWPNRNFLHAATSDGETNIELRFYDDPTIFELLEKNGHDWRIYFDDTPQIWAFNDLWDSPERHARWFPMDRFEKHVAKGDLPAYSFIEPNHRPPVQLMNAASGSGGVSNSQHPENNLVANDAYDDFGLDEDSDFARAEALTASIYESLRANPELFAKTLLVITYDEHGGFYDHVPPPKGVVNPGDERGWLGRMIKVLWHKRAAAFDFTMLGVRVPTVVVSPLIEPRTVEHTVLEHASVPATLRAIFAPDAMSLTERDAEAATFHHLASREPARTDLPDLSQYVATPDTGDEQVAAATDTPVMPEYYREFVGQAELVRQHLDEVGEPEAAPLEPATTTLDGAKVTNSFADAAHRHRHPEEAAGS